MAFASTLNNSPILAGIAHRVEKMVEDYRANAVKRRAFKQTYRELNALSSRELADLGINRSMIKRIALEASEKAH